MRGRRWTLGLLSCLLLPSCARPPALDSVSERTLARHDPAPQPGSGLIRRQIGDWRTVKLLKYLLADPRREVQIGACAELTSTYWGQDACWDDLDLGNAGNLPSVSVSRKAERLRRQQTSQPDQWWKLMSARYPPNLLLDQLRLLTAHKDPRIRAKYCRFLKSHYAGETDCGCGPPLQKLRGPRDTRSSTLIVSFTTNGSPYFTPMRLP